MSDRFCCSCGGEWAYVETVEGWSRYQCTECKRWISEPLVFCVCGFIPEKCVIRCKPIYPIAHCLCKGNYEGIS